MFAAISTFLSKVPKTGNSGSGAAEGCNREAIGSKVATVLKYVSFFFLKAKLYVFF